MNVLITLPALTDQGGVAGFYQSVLPYLNAGVDCSRPVLLEIGSTKGINKTLYPLLDQLRFLSCISKNKFDIIHINPSLKIKSFLRDGMIIYLAGLKRIPVLVFFHGWDVEFERQVETKLKWFFKKTYLKANGFIVLASDFKKKLRDWGVTAPIYMGTTAVDESILAKFSMPVKTKILQNSKQIKILFFSRIEKEKGIFETIDAFNILLKRGRDVSLSIAGDGSAMESVRSYITKKNVIADRINLLGYVTGREKRTALMSHHIYCLPTYGEGMPTTVLEAMAFGMPVITRPVGGIKDFFVNGEMGFLADEKSPEIIADLIDRLIGDRQKMAKMASYNHFFAKKHFMASVVGKKINDIYMRMIERA